MKGLGVDHQTGEGQGAEPCRSALRPGRRCLSAFIICQNESDRIERCLASLQGWADQIVVLDSGSTDGTQDIVRRYTPLLVETDWPGYGPQRNRALAHCSHDWVLSIDADEWLSDELKASIDAALSEPDLRATVLKLPWRTHFLGRQMRFGRYSTPQAKMFRREGTRFRDHQVHESLLMTLPRIERVVRGPLHHDSWRSFEHAQQKHLKYAGLLAAQKFAAGKRSNLLYAALRFKVDFLQQYVLRGGFLDGWRGLLMAMMLGQYAFAKYAALWSLEQQARHGNVDADALPRSLRGPSP